MADVLAEALRALKDPHAYLGDFSLHSRSVDRFTGLVKSLVEEIEHQKLQGIHCPVCGDGVPGKDALCDEHWAEYLGTHLGGRSEV